MLFKCPRCGVQQRLGSLLTKADQLSQERDRAEQPERAQMGHSR
jgi:hypothetical protein